MVALGQDGRGVELMHGKADGLPLQHRAGVEPGLRADPEPRRLHPPGLHAFGGPDHGRLLVVAPPSSRVLPGVHQDGGGRRSTPTSGTSTPAAARSTSTASTRRPSGPVTARITARHRWEAKDRRGPSRSSASAGTSRRTTSPGSPYWLFDLTSTQQAIGEPLEVLRTATAAWPIGARTVREGDARRPDQRGPATAGDGDQKPARWVDLTGPGRRRLGPVCRRDDPRPPDQPQHPDRRADPPDHGSPFFCYVPGHDVMVTISADSPTVFRYRVMIHDGHPDAALDERLWRDFAEPPRVTVAASGG